MTEARIHVAGDRGRAASSIMRNNMKYLDYGALDTYDVHTVNAFVSCRLRLSPEMGTGGSL